MMRHTALFLFMTCLFFTVGIFAPVEALIIQDPSEIRTLGVISFGEDGAAVLSWGGREMFVTPGYMIGSDLRVVAVRYDAVVLYRERQRQYFMLPIQTHNIADKDRRTVIWCSPLDIWKVMRMAGLAYRKDWICHWETKSEVTPRRHVQNLFDLMKIVVNPNHRYYGREGVMYVAPVHVYQGTGWQLFQRRVRDFRSRKLADRFPSLSQKGSLICSGKPLEQVLEDIAFRTGIPVQFQLPAMVPVYCTFRDRPWHEILEHVLIFNGLWVTPTPEGLWVGVQPPK